MSGKELKPKGPSSVQLLNFCQGLTYFCAESDQEYPPVTLQYTAPRGKVPPLVVIVGENAGGKSFLRRIITIGYRRLDVELIHISMEGRRNVSYNPIMVMVYGGEDQESTGANPANTVLGAISTSKKREKPHAIFWDEPDIGLSDGWAACMGREIATFMKKKPELLQAAYIVTHNRALVSELAPLNPLFVYVGEDRDVESLDAWLTSPPPKYKSLEDLRDLGVERFRRIAALQRKMKEEDERQGKF